MKQVAEREEVEFPEIRVGVRTGDTPQAGDRRCCKASSHPYNHPGSIGAGPGGTQVPGEALPSGIRDVEK